MKLIYKADGLGESNGMGKKKCNMISRKAREERKLLNWVENIVLDFEKIVEVPLEGYKEGAVDLSSYKEHCLMEKSERQGVIRVKSNSREP